ncbi:MAG: MotA/TolQ/ExbB proton channel family protein, partial [Methylophilaceae bacterium]|nr:MotA/TolQ/ExbB proton channel family protein [Methylophilaceae bacterium]
MITHDMSFLTLILEASLPVQLVMSILLLTSLFSWWSIFIKYFMLKHAAISVRQFETTFARTRDIKKFHDSLAGHAQHGMGRIFEAGFKEYWDHEQQRQADLSYNAEKSDIMEGARRAMRVSYNHELEHLEAHLPALATISSVSPYVGLFGTVWGIMNAFIGLSHATQATLSQVAPGIAEALIATAMGLF